jgi:TetR/AcrR family transcriptional repressor of lmrAB and yxaGH operons
MKKGERTKARMVDVTANLLQRQGFHATGLTQVIADSGAPKGSLYFHVPGGKEELACAALDDAGRQWRERLGLVIDAAPTPGDAIEAVCRALAQQLAASDYALGCPLATVALEAAATSEPVRAVCAQHYRAWEQLITDRAVAAGMAPDAAERAATAVLSAVEGALLLARVYRSEAPLLRTGALLRGVFEAQLD